MGVEIVKPQKEFLAPILFDESEPESGDVVRLALFDLDRSLLLAIFHVNRLALDVLEFEIVIRSKPWPSWVCPPMTGAATSAEVL